EPPATLRALTSPPDGGTVLSGAGVDNSRVWVSAEWAIHPVDPFTDNHTDVTIEEYGFHRGRASVWDVVSCWGQLAPDRRRCGRSPDRCGRGYRSSAERCPGTGHGSTESA